ncbi:alpha/beta hydrolase [Chitinilyticum aquatile]|uniref:alpha/beta hydrolase n=1 Tax=Chitinilyticum aquatile TaxID=362520 RepID=UPI0004047DF0|nr:alpha/beta fold hydrolase [Chitinilyticum aquatile]
MSLRHHLLRLTPIRYLLRLPTVRLVMILLAGALLPVIALTVLWLRQLPELSLWHTHVPPGEFTAQRQDIRTLADYRKLEDALLADVASQVVARTPADEQRLINRYSPRSLANPLDYAQNWNRTFELPGDAAKPAVLLLHGLSDSPYSLRTLAQALNRQGYHVVGLRLPGHGTVPAALTQFAWQDAAAAVRLAMRDLAARRQPVHLVGYSTGATLALEYQLARLRGEALPPLASMTLISPAVGVTPAAGYASFVKLLAPISGIGAAAWSDIVPEFDPYKYNSFPFNAAVQIDRLTSAVKAGIRQQAPLQDWPPTSVFISAVDNTVVPQAAVTDFMSQLASPGHQLMLFDRNRYIEMSPVLRDDPGQWALALADQSTTRPYRLLLLSNRRDTSSQELLIEDYPAGSLVHEDRLSDYVWPEGVFALAHVSLPFPPDDPLLGVEGAAKTTPLNLSRRLVGERGVLAIGAGDLLRLRYNPFYTLVENETLSFIAQHSATGAKTRTGQQTPTQTQPLK